MIFEGLFGLGMINILSGILYKVFLCMAVYKDAKEHDDKNAVLWTILVAFFGLIPTVIYLIFRIQKEKEFIRCPHCGKMIAKKYPVCMFCKQPINDSSQEAFVSEEVKKYLVIAGVLFIIRLIVSNLISLSGARQGVTFNPFLIF